MSWETFVKFLNETNPASYVPDGFLLVPIPSAGSPNGFVVWMLSEAIVNRAKQRGVF